MERFFDQHGFAVQAVMELSDNSAIKQAVAAGIGLAVISESAVELELAAQRMCILAVEGFPLVRHWYTVYLARKRLSPPAQAFLGLLHAEVQSGPVAP
jgi:LysR family transcriptional regulator, low CO2-responsive transcriptional regulator